MGRLRHNNRETGSTGPEIGLGNPIIGQSPDYPDER
jgi:hypothetical protein